MVIPARGGLHSGNDQTPWVVTDSKRSMAIDFPAVHMVAAVSPRSVVIFGQDAGLRPSAILNFIRKCPTY